MPKPLVLTLIPRCMRVPRCVSRAQNLLSNTFALILLGLFRADHWNKGCWYGVCELGIFFSGAVVQSGRESVFMLTLHLRSF